ncbi:bifunctional methylenetetrahydrofolate dehydrogenase/cyclohydrolase, mitochondrial-like [Tubulanus polymorphus]|uniref:bifunctional methylenetetrahydrofolate dehydrogenase/cyclohydrolase, mitochondrial-like n=1 Tax=Tubulanus polymorphus TaxID=672921 RepID=UPI003DA22098
MSSNSLMSSLKLLRISSQTLQRTPLRRISRSNKRFKAQIIDGKAVAKQIKHEVKEEVDVMVAAGERRPHLSVILVGDDPASHTYVRNKVKACQFTGISSETVRLPDTISQKELLHRINDFNSNPDVDGLLVQLPVPRHINERAVCNAVCPSKDVDGFHLMNVGRFCTDLDALLPATPAGVMELIRRSGIETFGKNAVVCGRSKNVGMPLAILLHGDGVGETDAGDATTTICHRYTPPDQLRAFVKMADILVVATGIPGLITGDMVKEGVAVIDVGINRIKDEQTGKYKLVGDVDFEGVSEKASYITPVPGGVGPMTVAMLMKNTLKAAKRVIVYD